MGVEADFTNQLDELRQEVSALQDDASANRLSMVFFSGELDKAIAAFIIATGAAAAGMEVVIFFTFWGTAILRDPNKTAQKSLMGRMFGWMLPRGSRKLKLSKMDMAGMGPVMIRNLMKKKGVASLEELIEVAGEQGVRIYVCTMTQDLMEIKNEEIIDYPHLDYCGVTTFVDLAAGSKTTLFI